MIKILWKSKYNKLLNEIDLLKEYNQTCTEHPFEFKVGQTVVDELRDVTGVVVELGRSGYGYPYIKVFDGERIHEDRQSHFKLKNINK